MSYEHSQSPLVRHYDADYASVRDPSGDIAFYVEEARRAGGPYLELGCGTARILGRVVEAGIEACGVDASEAMLAVARRKLGDRVRLVHADMRDVELGRRFALVTIPFRALSHVLDAEDHVRTFANALRHSAPGGRLVFDLFQPDPRFLAEGGPEKLQVERVAEGRRVRRYARAVPHLARQVSDVVMRWEIERQDGSVEKEEARFAMRWFHRFEVEHALARAGWSLEAVHGDFDRSPLGDESREMIFHARPA